jgi:hypothetical protein
MCYTSLVGGHCKSFNPYWFAGLPTFSFGRKVGFPVPIRKPRVNVVVSQEQHDLLRELASLDPSTRSASSFMRQLLDQVTPLLRVTIPMMRVAAQEMESGRAQLQEPVRNFMAALDQLDLLDHAPPQAARTERGEGVRPGRKPRTASK